MAKRNKSFTYHVPPGQPWAEFPSQRRDPATADETTAGGAPSPAPDEPGAGPPPPWLQSTPAPTPSTGIATDAPPEPSWLYQQPATPPPPPSHAPPSWGAYAGYGNDLDVPGARASDPPPTAPLSLPLSHAPVGRPSGDPRNRNRSLVAVLVAIVVALAGVGGYVALHRGSSVALQTRPPDLHGELLTLADLPTGWTVDPSSNGNSNGGPDPACLQKASEAMNTPTQAESDFTSTPNWLSDNLAWFPGTGATLAIGTLSKTIASCGQVTLSDGSGFAATGRFSPMAISPLGDQATAWQLAMTVEEGGQRVPLDLDVVVVRVHQTIVTVSDLALGAPDPSLVQSLAQKAVAKAA